MRGRDVYSQAIFRGVRHYSEGTRWNGHYVSAELVRTDITLNRGLVWSSQMPVFKWCLGGHSNAVRMTTSGTWWQGSSRGWQHCTVVC